MKTITGIMLTEKERCRLKQQMMSNRDDLNTVVSNPDIENSEDNFQMIQNMIPFRKHKCMFNQDEYLEQNYPRYNKETFLTFIKDIVDYVKGLTDMNDNLNNLDGFNQGKISKTDDFINLVEI